MRKKRLCKEEKEGTLHGRGEEDLGMKGKLPHDKRFVESVAKNSPKISLYMAAKKRTAPSKLPLCSLDQLAKTIPLTGRLGLVTIILVSELTKFREAV